jgi:phosphonate transport system substrate-binding protein
MRHNHLRVRAAAMAAALVLVAASCGGDDGDTVGAETTGPSTTTAAADSGTTTQPAETEASVAGADARPDDWPETLTFGAVPSENASTLELDYALSIEILEAELGVDVELFQAADYAGIVEAQIAGTVDVAQYGPFSFIIAENNGADISPAGVMAESADEDPGYRSYGFTQASNTEINSIDDFAGRSVCFVDPGSTSGFLYPSAGLLGAGIDPETGIQATFAGGHDASALSVANGSCEAGFAFDTMITSQLIDSGEIAGVVDETGEDENVNDATANIKIVWKSPVIPASPLAINNSLPTSFVDAFIDVVTTKLNRDWASENGYCASADECAFPDESWGYVARDTTFFDGVRQVCAETQAPACTSAA